MVIGLSIVAVSYFLANLSFFSVLSNEEIIGTQAVALVSQTLGLITSQYYHSKHFVFWQPFGEAVLGKAALVIFPVMVAVSTFGASLLSYYLASRYIHVYISQV